MTGFDSGDRRPLTYFRGYPVYFSTWLVALYVAAMVMGVIGSAFMRGAGDGVGWWAFSPAGALGRGRLWQFVTYALCNGPSLWFVIEMLLLYRFGREIETYLGRRAFLRLYLVLVLVPPLILAVLSPWMVSSLSGSAALHFALFVAFAALYPGVPMFFGVTARWMAGILLGVYSLELLSLSFGGHSGALAQGVVLWGSAGSAYWFVAREKGGGPFWGNWSLPGWFGRFVWRKGPRFSVVREVVDLEGMDGEKLLATIDPLLEKISQSGLSSLTRSERARLEAARSELMRKEVPRR
jgi:membrane associated rhomboid family serine protease